MHQLASLLLERVSAGLKRRSLSDPASWALAYRIMGKPYPGPWTFRWHPWLKAMHESKSEFNVGQKAAQLGFTETLLNITFYKIDVERTDCLYVLPAKTPDASDFSTGRFDPALELSPHLSKLFSNVKNIGHKRAGTTNLYVRGSKSRAGLKSIPTGFIGLDELDEMEQDNITLALERASGQTQKQIWMISTPTIDHYGINKFYTLSTQESYFFRCPHCSRMTQLLFPDCLEITAESLDDPNITHSHLKCKECHHILDHGTKPEWLATETSEWVPEYRNRDIRGFHINQLYSSTVSPVDLARAYLRALRDPSDEQSFWNDKMGLPHLVEGARLTDHQIEATKANHLNGTLINTPGIVTMGVDVGKHLHYEVDAWTLGPYITSTDLNTDALPKVIEIGKLQHFEALDDVMRKYRVMACIIDANPEKRKALEFAFRFHGHVKLCYYGAGIHSKTIHETKTQNMAQPEPTITVDRTAWLDLSLGRFRNQTITIPANTPFEYRDHLKALTRIYEKDREGNPIGRYVKGTLEDHYCHARNYSEIALPFAAYLSNPRSIPNPI